jgi:hypothetical protein
MARGTGDGKPGKQLGGTWKGVVELEEPPHDTKRGDGDDNEEAAGRGAACAEEYE